MCSFAYANEPWELGAPYYDWLEGMRYGQDANSLASVAAGMDIQGVSVMVPSEFPSLDSLSDIEVWMLAGLRPEGAPDGFTPEWQCYFEHVKQKVMWCAEENGYLPASLEQILQQYPFPDQEIDFELYDRCFRNPFTGMYPQLDSRYGSPGDFFVCLLDSTEIEQFAEYNHKFAEMYYEGQRTVYDMPERTVRDVSPVRITCMPVYIRMYGLDGALRDGIYWKWDYTDPERHAQYAQTGR
jgi:hypothetical protein